MAMVKALRDCFIEGGRYVTKDEELDYSGPKNENLMPTKQAKAAEDKAKAEADRAAAEAEAKAAEEEAKAAAEAAKTAAS